MEYAIEISDIIKEYSALRALDGISFKVKNGGIHGFLGPNGAGKSTTMKIITGTIVATSGRISICGMDAHKNRDRLNSLIGYLPEVPPLYPGMKVNKYLCFVAGIYGVEGKNLKEWVELAMKTCGIKDVQGKFIGTLSKGYKQRVGIAQALVHRPKVIILDEPTSSLDPSAIVEIRELILSLKEKHTILLSTHLLHEAEQVCSDITIINKGRIVSDGSVEDIRDGLHGRQVVEVEVLNWNDDKKAGLMDALDCDIEVISQNRPRFCFKTDEDMRPALSRELIKAECALLSLKQERIQLEDIFKSAIQR